MDEAGATFHRALGWAGGINVGGDSVRQSGSATRLKAQIRFMYDPDKGWITSDESRVRTSLAKKATTTPTTTPIIKYSVLVLDAWILTLVSASVTITGVFLWASPESMQTRTALLLVYLYGFLTFFLSNGAILRGNQ